MIKRSSPDIGYLDPNAFDAMGMSQVVRAKDTVYIAGVVSAKGLFEGLHAGDPTAQIHYVIDVLEKLLASEGMTLANLVSTVLYTPSVEELTPGMGAIAERFGENRPCLSVIGVSHLGIPGNMLELTAVAVD